MGLRLLVGILVAFVGPARCAGGDQPSRHERTRRAAAICQDLNRQLNLLGGEISVSAATVRDLPAIELYLDRFVPILRGHLRQLRRLHRPSQRRGLLRRVLADLRREVRHDERARQAPRRRDISAFHTAARRGEAIVPGLQRLARRYGFTVWGRVA